MRPGIFETASRSSTLSPVFSWPMSLLACKHCDYWSKVRKKSGEIRSVSFPIYLRFAAAVGVHARHNKKMKRNLLAFEDRWDLLSEPIDHLHDKTAWSLK